MRTTALASLFAATLMMYAGCGGGVTEYRADASGRLRKVGTFTPDGMVRRNIERAIELQLSGHAPYAGSKTWRDYWREFYRIQYPPEGAVEFKSREQIEAYTKQRLRARGLPTYD